MNDLESRLRSSGDLLPGPGEDATAAGRRVLHQALSASTGTGRRPLAWMRARRHRTYLLAAAAALVVAGGALAATRWSVADLPPFGDGGREAFVLPATDVLPGGYERSRPPRFADLPTRPSLLFPAGVGYTEAVDRYARARARGEVLPAGVELADPLPAGKAVLVREDDRIAIDPAAPVGYSALTGLVQTLEGPLGGASVPIARCQLLLGADDPHSPPCDRPGVRRAYVREGVNGRWVPSPNEEEYADRLVTASTELSVLERPATAADRLEWRARSGLPGPAPEVSKARLALSRPGLRVYVAPSTRGGVCLIEQSRRGGAGTCSSRGALASRGAITLGSGPPNPRYRLTGLVGDGIDLVRAPDGASAPVRDNVFTIGLAEGIDRLTLSGPVGGFELSVPRVVPGPRPDRTREREAVGIHLAAGGRASIRVAPVRGGGGRCRWVYIKGVVRSFGCRRPGDAPLPYDVVTAGFNPGGPGYPFVYEGELAPQVGAVEMSFRDGTTERLPITEGFVLYEIPPSRIASRARWPVAVTTFDRQGVPLVRDRLRGFATIVRQQRPSP